jgi:hypothetical protein
MKIKFTLLITIFSLNLFSQVGGESIYNFLNISGSAKQAALGGNVITLLNDVNQPLWNPAAINQNLNGKLGVNYLNYLGDINYLSASYAFMFNQKLGTFQTGVSYMNYGNFIGADEGGVETGEFRAYDLAFSVGYAYNFLGTNFFLGANIKLINSVIENYSSFGIGTDIGLLYYNEQNPFLVTLVVRNIGYQITAYDQLREKLPLDIVLGMSYQMEKVPIKWHVSASNLQQWNLAVSNPSNSSTDLDGNETEESITFFDNFIRHFNIGAEFFPESIVNVRLGYNFRRASELSLNDTRTFAGFTAGFGINFTKFSFNYAFTKYHPASNTSTFSLVINLN